MDESAPNFALVPGTKAKLIAIKARPERAEVCIGAWHQSKADRR
jgi:hypothetical protein